MTTDPTSTEPWPPPDSTRAHVVRLALVLVVVIVLAMLLMAATHTPSGGCGGG